MKIHHATAIAVALTMICGAPALAQTTRETKVDHDTKVHDGVATATTKVTQSSKRKTHRPKKVLGLKVGHKTVEHKTVRESSVSSNGDHSVKIKTSH